MYSTECLKLLREYIQIQVDIARNTPSPSEMTSVVAHSSAIQEALWQQVREIAAKDNAMVRTGLFIQSLNEMIDDREKRLIANANRVPNIHPDGAVWCRYLCRRDLRLWVRPRSSACAAADLCNGG